MPIKLRAGDERIYLSRLSTTYFSWRSAQPGGDYVLVLEALTIWHNEARPDRVSLSDRLAKWRATVQLFFDSAANLVPPHVRIACEARFLSGVLWRTSRTESLKLLLRAQRSGALSTWQIAMLFCRNAMPPPRFYDTIRHWLPMPRRSW